MIRELGSTNSLGAPDWTVTAACTAQRWFRPWAQIAGEPELTSAILRLQESLARSVANATFDIGRIEYQDAQRAPSATHSASPKLSAPTPSFKCTAPLDSTHSRFVGRVPSMRGDRDRMG